MAGYHLGPLELGQVKAHMEHGFGCAAIQKRAYKADGKILYGETAIVNAMSKLQAVTTSSGALNARC